MPTVSKYVEVSDEQIKSISGFVRRWIEETGCTQEQFADRYNEIMRDRFQPGTVVPMDRYRVLAILNAARASSSTRVAKVLRCREAEIISLVIGVPVEVLLGQESESTRGMIDVAATTQDAAAFLELMASEQAKMEELIGWAEFLPCSLEPPAFMHAHHQALFSKYPEDVMVWDSIGNSRRNGLLAKENRGWRMTQLNFFSDLQRIAQGGNEYANISPELRDEFLENLIRLLSDHGLNIRLLIADDENDQDVKALKSDFRYYDSVITWDEKLVILRDRFGITYHSRKLRHTKFWRGMQQEFIALAKFTQLEDVIRILRDLQKTIPSKRRTAISVPLDQESRGDQWARLR